MRRLVRRLAYLVRWRRRDDDLEEELAFHRAMKARELERGGFAGPDLGAAVQRAIGSEALARNRARDVWIWPWLQDAAQDLRFAVRLLAKDRKFTAVAAAVLGLGIGVDNALLIAVNATCLRGLPIPRADRVLQLSARDAQQRELPLSYREFEALASSERDAFASLAAHATATVAVGEAGRAPDRAVASYISSATFSLLGERPILGRDFRVDDDRPGAQPVTLLGYGLWQSRYAGDPAVVGRTIRINGTPATVVGVMADGFKFPGFSQVWQPLAHMPRLAERRSLRTLTVIGRLSDTSTTVEALRRLTAAGQRLARDYPETNRDIRIAAVPINEKYTNRITDPQWAMFLIVGFVIVVIACANVGNLLLMRAVVRGREIAIRGSLGASRYRIVRQLLIESVALAAIGGVAGGFVSMAGARLLTSLVPESQMPYWVRFTMDARVFAALCLVCLGTAVLFGLAPALHAGNTDLVQPMRDGAPTSGRSSARWSTALLALEFALTTMLAANVVGTRRAGAAAARADAAFDPANVITTWTTLPGDRYPTAERRLAFYGELRERVAALPRTPSVEFATALPLGGAAPRQLALEGRPPDAGAARPTVWNVVITGGYFAALRAPLLRGRTFDDRDGAPGAEAAIVNQRFAEMYLAGSEPIGRRISLKDPSAPAAASPWLTIVGIAPSIRQRADAERDPIVYLPLRAAAPVTAVAIVRGSADPAAAAALRDVVRRLDPDLPLYRLMPMEQALVDSQWAGRGSATIFNAIAIVALLLATAGLYAVTAHAVVERTREIGVRTALGAHRGDIVRLVLDRAARQVAVGAAAGVGLTFAWQRMTVALFGSSPIYRMTDAGTFVAVVAALASIAALACLAPTRRALAVDPATILRSE
jgi:putative ABC transport system permease protein